MREIPTTLLGRPRAMALGSPYRDDIDFQRSCSEDVSASLSHPFGDQEDPTGTASVPFSAALGSFVTLGVLAVVAVVHVGALLPSPLYGPSLETG